MSFTSLLDPNVALSCIEKTAGPRLKAIGKGLVGATLGYGVYRTVAEPVAELLSERAVRDIEVADVDRPIRITKDTQGKHLLPWIQKFKDEHPEVKDVPVYVSSELPTSAYVRQRAFDNPEVAKNLKRVGINNPGVYVREMAAPVALHELGHAAIEKKVPGISLLTHGTSLLSLPILAWAVLRRPGGAPKFIHKYAPAIAAALQIPLLAEEAAASIMAEKTLRREGQTGKKTFQPSFLSYVAAQSKIPLMATGALLLKR